MLRGPPKTPHHDGLTLPYSWRAETRALPSSLSVSVRSGRPEVADGRLVQRGNGVRTYSLHSALQRIRRFFVGSQLLFHNGQSPSSAPPVGNVGQPQVGVALVGGLSKYVDGLNRHFGRGKPFM